MALRGFLNAVLTIVFLALLAAVGIVWWLHRELSANDLIFTWPRLVDAANYAAAALIFERNC